MGCNCKLFEAIIGIIVIVFAFFDTVAYSTWILIIAGIALLLHSFMCKNCKPVKKAGA